MTKKKEVEDNLAFENKETVKSLLGNDNDITLDEVDFNELLELEEAMVKTVEQVDKISGNMFRLSKDQEMCFTHERNLNSKMDLKRKELIKRYKIAEDRVWRVDLATHKVVYQQ